ncbi:SLAM family member 8 isoform 2-T2 [Discoglossus pictus]
MIGWITLAIVLQTVVTGHKVLHINGAVGQSIQLSPVVSQDFITRDTYWRYLTSTEEMVVSSSRGLVEKEYHSRFVGRVHLFNNFTMQLQDLVMADTGTFSCMLVDTGGRMAQQTFHLKVYEVVEPVIKVFTSEHLTVDGECHVFLNCVTTRGSNVSYSWTAETWHGEPLNSSYTLYNDGQLLMVVLEPKDRNVWFICTVSNPVSQKHKTVVPWKMCETQSGAGSNIHNWKVIPYIAMAIIIGLVAVIICVFLFTITTRKKRECTKKEEEETALQQVLEVRDQEQVQEEAP